MKNTTMYVLQQQKILPNKNVAKCADILTRGLPAPLSAGSVSAAAAAFALGRLAGPSESGAAAATRGRRRDRSGRRPPLLR